MSVVPAAPSTARSSPPSSAVTDGPPPSSCDVVVVGAGLAGLACARALQASGLHVVVVEADDGVGGRVRTDVVDGWRADRGFQLLNPTYPALHPLVDVDALRLQPLGAGVVVHRTSTGVSSTGTSSTGVSSSRTLLADPREAPAALLPALRSGLLPPGDLLGLLRLVGRALLSPVWSLETAPDTGWHAAFDAAGLTGPLRRQVVEPFLTGTLADADGVTSRRYVDLLLRSFALAVLGPRPGLPVGGMQAFSDAVAAPLPAGSVHVGTRVAALELDGGTWRTSWHETHGGAWDRRTDGAGPRPAQGQLASRAVVLATDVVEAARLTGPRVPDTRSLTTYWHVTEEPPVTGARARYLHVDGDRSHIRPGGLVNTVVLSRSAPDYAPPGAPAGAELVATTILGVPGDDGADLERHVREQAGRVLGADPARWQLLTTHAIPRALPRTPPGLDVRRSVRPRPGAMPGLAVVGDHRDTPSVQGALVSGRRGARAVLDQLSPADTPEELLRAR